MKQLDSKVLFDGAIGTLLVLAILMLGVLFGLSISVLNNAIAGESLLSLWGPALGASIAATATLSAAMYSQRRAERRELRPKIRAIEKKLNTLFGEIGRVDALIARCQREHRNGQDFDYKFARNAINQVFKAAHAIEIDDGIPLTVKHHVEGQISAVRTCMFEAADAIDTAGIAQQPDADGKWDAALEFTEAARGICADVFRWLRRWAD